MDLTKLRISNFRCLEAVDVEPGRGLNLIVGPNASGKSSLLEAIYFLARAQSFRRAPASRIIRKGSDQASVFALIENEQRGRSRLGIAQRGQQTRIKIAQMPDASRYDLVRALPAQIIDPGVHRLLEEGPVVRRRYLDWGVFHVEQSFYGEWQRYRRCLLQRNRALRAGAPVAAITAWDAELIRSASAVDACRQDYVAALSKLLPGMAEEALGEGRLQLDYHSGWPRGVDLAEALPESLDSDRRSGYTRLGPHRADIRIHLAGQQARDRVSRGQQKILGASLLIAQARLHTQTLGVAPVLLIDDVAAELGDAYRATLLSMLKRTRAQCFLTFLQENDIPEQAATAKMFHVEHGVVAPAA